MKLSSVAFEDKGRIPSKYTCDGQDISPPLAIADVPKETKSLVLIMDDPDVPKKLRADGMWVHWVIFNMPASLREIGENEQPTGIPGKGTEGKEVYRGPAPPDREHRYFFKLFALDCQLALKRGATKEEILFAMKGHTLAESELMGLYERIKSKA